MEGNRMEQEPNTNTKKIHRVGRDKGQKSFTKLEEMVIFSDCKVLKNGVRIFSAED